MDLSCKSHVKVMRIAYLLLSAALARRGTDAMQLVEQHRLHCVLVLVRHQCAPNLVQPARSLAAVVVEAANVGPRAGDRQAAQLCMHPQLLLERGVLDV